MEKKVRKGALSELNVAEIFADMQRREDERKADKLFQELSESINAFNFPTPPQIEVDESISSLKQKVSELTQKLKQQSREKDADIANLNKALDDLNSAQSLSHIYRSVTKLAHDQLKGDDKLRKGFEKDADTSCFVVSIDIRRSTELMLKAKNPGLFASFITELCDKLTSTVREHLGVIDKFTGDGILAFFPDFFSGQDAGFLALKSCEAAHGIFEECYKRHRSSFTSILKDVGLGIGVDCGPVRILQVNGSLTVVGSPVVYACRLGGAPANRIYVNQSAFDILSERYPLNLYFSETQIDVKHEGSLLCYEAKFTKRPFKVSTPEWHKSARLDMI